MNPAAIDAAAREMRALQARTRSTRRALRVLQDSLDQRTLGTYVLGAGEQVDSEIVDFLRLTVSGVSQEVTITITAPKEGTDKETR